MKYIVGDKVVVRDWDDMVAEYGTNSDGYIEMPRFCFTPYMKIYCGKTFTILDVKSSNNAYILSGQEEIPYMFTDEMIYRVSEKDVTFMNHDLYISDINILVPDKVVEVVFNDDKKEKMLCHEDDTFDLKDACFIAISKHLYRDTYTFDGIEHMANEMKYQKKYVKMVDKAVKNYKKKIDEIEKAKREEEEERIIRERQRLKRRKQKERRAEKHRKIIVNILAESINKAKKDRKVF